MARQAVFHVGLYGDMLWDGTANVWEWAAAVDQRHTSLFFDYQHCRAGVAVECGHYSDVVWSVNFLGFGYIPYWCGSSLSTQKPRVSVGHDFLAMMSER